MSKTVGSFLADRHRISLHLHQPVKPRGLMWKDGRVRDLAIERAGVCAPAGHTDDVASEGVEEIERAVRLNQQPPTKPVNVLPLSTIWSISL